MTSPAPISDRPIFLIGYRCTGKTTIAGLLAKELGRDALDADVLLEQRLGRSIRDIFAEEGEASFREHEASQLRELSARQRHVIATGGGVILRDDNRALLRSSGTCVWLTADPATLWQRLQADQKSRGQRPDLTTGGLAEIEDLLQKRTPLYEACASVTVSTVARTPGEIVAEILAYLHASS